MIDVCTSVCRVVVCLSVPPSPHMPIGARSNEHLAAHSENAPDADARGLAERQVLLVAECAVADLEATRPQLSDLGSAP